MGKDVRKVEIFNQIGNLHSVKVGIVFAANHNFENLVVIRHGSFLMATLKGFLTPETRSEVAWCN